MALATSKRKFYKLLDNLSRSSLQHQNNSPLPSANPSTTSLSIADKENADEAEPNQISPDRPNKRYRMLANQVAAPTATQQITTPVRRPVTGTIGPLKSSVRVISSKFESKKPVAGPASTSATPLAANSTTTTISASSSSVDPATSIFAPWNHEHFLARLKTFADVKTWSPKPKAIDEVAWAKRGWINVGAEEVGCRACGKRLVVKLEEGARSDKYAKPVKAAAEETDDQKWWIEEAEKTLVERYESLVVEAHTEGCLWKRSGCKEDIYRIKFSDVSTWQKELFERYESLLSMNFELPTSILTPAFKRSETSDELSLEEISRWFTSVMTQSTTAGTEPDPINNVALTLALCGWSGKKIVGVQFAYCQKCFARVGFWLYRLGSAIEDDESLKLNPVTLHRSHCPWQNAESQDAPGEYSGLAGWQVMREVISILISRAERNKRVLESRNGTIADTDDSEYRPSTGVSVISKTKEEVDLEDKMRESKLARLKRAFNVRKSKSRATLKSNASANTSTIGL